MLKILILILLSFHQKLKIYKIPSICYYRPTKAKKYCIQQKLKTHHKK
jgi:hypothetical protein